MLKLNFPVFDFRIKNNENKTLIFDIIRKKFVVLTPEEWVRQHVVHHLIFEKGFSAALINVLSALYAAGRFGTCPYS